VSVDRLRPSPHPVQVSSRMLNKGLNKSKNQK